MIPVPEDRQIFRIRALKLNLHLVRNIDQTTFIAKTAVYK
jgi:hypothetical protein